MNKDLESRIVDDYDEANWMVMSHQGHSFYTSHKDGSIKVWNAETLKLINTIGVIKHKILALAVSVTDKYLVAQSSEKSLLIYDMNDD